MRRERRQLTSGRLAPGSKENDAAPERSILHYARPRCPTALEHLLGAMERALESTRICARRIACVTRAQTPSGDNMPSPLAPAKVIEAVRKHPGTRVKVAVSDIDGILRGKYLHKDKFVSATESGFGFCDVVFGWDSQDVCYDNTALTGWQHGFPDAVARIDLGTYRHVPWDNGVPFFLGDFVSTKNGREVPHPVCPRQVLRRVLRRAEKMGFTAMCGMEFSGSISAKRHSRGRTKKASARRR